MRSGRQETAQQIVADLLEGWVVDEILVRAAGLCAEVAALVVLGEVIEQGVAVEEANGAKPTLGVSALWSRRACAIPCTSMCRQVLARVELVLCVGQRKECVCCA